MLLAETREMVRKQLLVAVEQDDRVVGCLDYGSTSEGRGDQYSDLDFALFIQDEAMVAFEQGWKAWVAQFGDLLLAYIGGVGHPWVVYDAEPLPLRMDLAFHPASALDRVLSWPNAPQSVEAMVLVDKTGGELSGYVQQIVGQYGGPDDLKQSFDQVCGDFWYYLFRTYTKLLRGELWSARYEFNFIMMGNLMALLRIEANAVDQWRRSMASDKIEQVLTVERLEQLNQCIPSGELTDLRRVFRKTAVLAYQTCENIAQTHGWSWPDTLAQKACQLVNKGLEIQD